jgi:ribonuclease HII
MPPRRKATESAQLTLLASPSGPEVLGAPDLLRPADSYRCGDLEREAARRGWDLMLGLDEAGRGPLAGPVVAAACSLPSACLEEAAALGLDDSKRLDEAAREALFGWITAHARARAVAIVSAAEIDAMNILRASLHAMRLAWDEVVTADPLLTRARVLVDGRDRAPLPEPIWQQPLIKGDGRSLNVAAASILAKVTRDRWMDEAHAQHPAYGFDRHRGYPTPAHRAAIARHGPCPLHRRSFTLLRATPDTPNGG